MTSTNENIRLLLTALMIGFVFTMAIAFSGIVAATDINRGDGASNTWDTADGEGEVGDNATVYQGEGDIIFNDGTRDISPSQLQATSGSNEGVPLDMPIPADQATGSYSNDGSSTSTSSNFLVTVATPRVTDLEITNPSGTDVAGSTLTTGNSNVTAEYNFADAEDLDLTVEDEDGLDVTGEVVQEVLVGNDGSSDTVTWHINTYEVDAGTYTFTVEGADDLDHSSATESTTVTITTDETDIPTAAFDYSPNAPSVDDSVTFDASESFDPDGEIVRYSWDFDGDGLIDQQSSAPSASYTYGEPMEYTVVLEVVDNDGAARQTETTIRVTEPPPETNEPPTAAFDYSPNAPSVDDSVTFDASESFDPDGEIVRYSWDFDGDRSFDQQLGTSSRSHTYDEPGEYAVVLEVVDDDGAVNQTETTIRVVGQETTITESTTTSTSTPDGTPTPDGTLPFQIGGFGLVGLTIGFLLGFFGNQEVKMSVVAVFGGIFSGQFFDLIPEDVNPGLILGGISVGVIIGVILGTIFRHILPEDSN